MQNALFDNAAEAGCINIKPLSNGILAEHLGAGCDHAVETALRSGATAHIETEA